MLLILGELPEIEGSFEEESVRSKLLITWFIPTGSSFIRDFASSLSALQFANDSQ